MLNKAMLIGRLGKDVEVLYTQSGTAVANFSIATEEKWKDKEGNQQAQTEWHNIVAFARLGEICGEYLSKGSQVYIEGKIQTRSWDDKDGNKRYTTEIVAREMKMLGTKGDNGGGGQPQAPPPQGNSGGSHGAGDDVPFNPSYF